MAERTLNQRAGCLFLCAVLLFFACFPAFAADTGESNALQQSILQTFRARREHTTAEAALLSSREMTDPAKGGSSAASSSYSDWIAFAMGRFGFVDSNNTPVFYDDEGQASYLAALDRYVTAAYAANGGTLSKTKATEAHRCALTMLSLGGDPRACGSYRGKKVDLIADGTYQSTVSVTRQGVTGAAFSLIALNAAVSSKTKQMKTFESEVLAWLLSAQLPSGGWTLWGDAADPDVTAIVLDALAFYDDSAVSAAIDRALTCLQNLQLPSGCFAGGGVPNCESTAQVLVALCALGLDPAKDPRFVKTGGSALQALNRFRLSDGSYAHTLSTSGQQGKYNAMATDQAAYALVACWRQTCGLRSLYDIRPDPAKGQFLWLQTALRTFFESLRLLLRRLGAIR